MGHYDDQYDDAEVTRRTSRTVQHVNAKSAQPCGCDPGANWTCQACRDKAALAAWKPVNEGSIGASGVATSTEWAPLTDIKDSGKPAGSRVFGTDATNRKFYPVFTGALMYFPDALAELARVSRMGNDQHNPGEPLHWSREKSTDQMDTASRHMIDHGTGYVWDSDGAYHLAKAAWRILAELQLTIEREQESK